MSEHRAAPQGHSAETIIKWLRQMQEEIRSEGHAGWGNTLDDVIAYVESAASQEGETPGALSKTRVGVSVTCAVCGNHKKPIGRSAPLSWYGCDQECSGYRQPPFPGSLWPGESEADFGYPAGTDGTTDAQQPPAESGPRPETDRQPPRGTARRA